MAVSDDNSALVCMQAFRLDHAEPTFADWAPGWIMGLYLRRGELLVPRAMSPPTRSVSERVAGPVVYHGELWIESTARARGLLDIVPRLGIFLAMMKWQPQAVWGIIGQSMAMRGQITRLGYATWNAVSCSGSSCPKAETRSNGWPSPRATHSSICCRRRICAQPQGRRIGIEHDAEKWIPLFG